MKPFSRSTEGIADVLGQRVVRLAAVVAGAILMIVGLGMMVSIVALPIGVVLELLGVLILVWGFFVRAEDSDERGKR
jgi:hypothetical protein